MQALRRVEIEFEFELKEVVAVAVALGRLLLLLLIAGKEKEYRHQWIKDINLSTFSVYRFHLRQEYVLFSQLLGGWGFVFQWAGE